MNLEATLNTLLDNLSSKDQLLCVTKYASMDCIQALYDLGIRQFGENKVQDAEKKIQAFQFTDCRWELIGHLQTNKAKKAVSLFDRIQSVDSIKLLKKINEEAQKIHKNQCVLIQLNFANDPQKFGFEPEFVISHLDELFSFSNITVDGIMTMAPYGKSEQELLNFFIEAKKFYDILKSRYNTIGTLSMGMSQDYELALKAGSTLIRLGSIFTTAWEKDQQ